MPPSDRLSRRVLLRAGAATAAASGVVGSASALGGDLDDDLEGLTESQDLPDAIERIPLLDVEDRTETVSPAVLTERAEGIRPGSQLFVDFGDSTGGCTANFIWRPAIDGDSGEEDLENVEDTTEDGTEPAEGTAETTLDDDAGTLYIGAAGHCFLDDDVDADEDAARDHEQGGDVSDLTVTVCADCEFGGLTGLNVVSGEVIELGDVVYARQTDPEEEGGTGVGHDFGLVEIPPEAEHLADPSLPRFGGPTTVSAEAVPAGEPINQYGAGIGNGELSITQASNGVSLGALGSAGGWYAALRASPGDSGSPIQESDLGSGLPQGTAAAGVLTHLTASGTAGVTIGRAMEMAAEDVGLEIEVVTAGDD